MQKISIFLIFLCLFLSTFKCRSDISSPETGEVRELTEVEKQISLASDKFGLNLFREINKSEKTENVFISPLSVSMALGMTLNGAGGNTFDAIKTTLQLNGLNKDEINSSYKSLMDLLVKIDPKVIFKFANSIWYRNTFTFENEFLETNKKYFYATVTALDFTNPNSVNIINNWVKESTNGLISKILENINSDEIMYLVNAIYFKGTWKYQFDKNNTKNDIFFNNNGTEVTVNMMFQENELEYLQNDYFKAVNLPYGDGAFSMMVFLPHKNFDINSFAEEFNEKNFDLWLKDFSKQKGEFQIPRFKIEYKVNLNDALKSLGMGIAFDAYQADFSNMYKGPDKAYISKVEHKTFAEVNEEGTEAAAVTSVTIGVTSIGTGFHMKVDRPFIFLIRENKSGTILFIGKIVKF
jgi:serpin B